MEERQSKFEILRIAAMLFIVASHYLVHGIGFENWAAGSLCNRMFSASFYAGGEIGVALFFMITGYFLVRKTSVSVKKVVLTTFFYAWVSVILYVCTIGIHSSLDVVHIARFLLIPVSSGNWWFVTVYVVLVIFSPVINQFLNSLTKRQFVFAVIFAWFFFYTLGSFYGTYFAAFQKAIFFYALGAFFNLHENKNRRIVLSASLLVVFAVVTFALSYYFLSSFNAEVRSAKQELLRITVTGLGVPLISVHLFVLCGFIADDWRCHAVNKISATTFGIYLLHDSVFFREILWGGGTDD